MSGRHWLRITTTKIFNGRSIFLYSSDTESKDLTRERKNKQRKLITSNDEQGVR